MSELNLEKKIENLKNEQEEAKELFWKYQGAIEFAELLINEIKKNSSSKKEDKK